MILNENLTIEQHASQFTTIFRKVDIYNARKSFLNENQYNDIVFSLNEQEAIKDMFRIMQYKILENNLPGELNEGLWDTIKQGASNLKDKAQAGIDKLKQLPEKARKAYEFCQKIIQKSVTKVSELIKYIEELFMQLADTVRGAIIQLGGFGKAEIAESSEAFTQYTEDEKKFLEAVRAYVVQKKDDKRLIESFSFADFEDKVSNNTFFQVIFGGKYKGEKLSWWKSLLVSLVGSIVINLGVGLICAGLGIAAPTAATITSIVLAIWSLRGALRVLLNRQSQIKGTGEKFWNKSVIIQLVIVIGVTSFFQIPCVKEWMQDMIGAGVNKSSEWISEKFNSLMGLVGKNPSVEQVQDILNEGGAEAADVAQNAADSATQSVSDETVKSVKDQIATWMQGRGATGMAKAAGESLPVDAPGCDVYVVNGNANLIHAVKAIKDEIEKLGGQIVTSESSNSAGKTYLVDIIMPKDTDLGNLSQAAQDALKAHGANTTAFIKLENIGEVIMPEPEPVAPVDPEIITAGDYFGGLAFYPIFENLKNRIKISLGSEARQNAYVKVTEFKNMTLGEAQEAVSVLGDNVNNLGFKRLLRQDNLSKGYTAKISMISDSKLQEAEGEGNNDNKLKDAIKTNADPKNDKCLVFFTKVKSKDTYKELPLVAINYRTLYCVDLIKSKKLKSRKNPYFVKGLFNHLTIKPVVDGDEKAQEEIKKALMGMLYKSVLGLAKLCQVTIGEVKHFAKRNEWVPKAEDNQKTRLELGNFSTAEFCDILNNPKDCYKYFGGSYATDITKTDEHGNVLNTKNRHIKIEEKVKYVEEKIYPIVSNKNTDVYKEILDNELISKFFFDKDGNFKTMKLEDKEIPIICHPTISVALYRSPDNFNMETKKTVSDYISSMFGNKEKANAKDFAKATQLLSSIIWKYKGERDAWAKQLKEAGKNTNESVSKKPVVKIKKVQKISENQKIKNINKINEEIQPVLLKDSVQERYNNILGYNLQALHEWIKYNPLPY